MEGDHPVTDSEHARSYFNPLPPHGGRRCASENTQSHHRISIHSLRMEGDPSIPHIGVEWYAFQSTPSAWRETSAGGCDSVITIISIHSLRMEGDPPAFVVFKEEKHISIHSLRMEGDPSASAWRTASRISIHSLRMEGDMFFGRSALLRRHFNPLPPHGGRLKALLNDSPIFPFQSTPSAWRETFRRGGGI